MPYTDAAKHRMLDHLVGNTASGGAITQVSLHDASPPSDLNELSGGSYTRETVTWTAAGVESAGRVDHGTLTFDVPGGNTVSAVAYRAADGTIMAYADVTDETFAGDGQYQITDASYLHLNA